MPSLGLWHCHQMPIHHHRRTQAPSRWKSMYLSPFQTIPLRLERLKAKHRRRRWPPLHTRHLHPRLMRTPRRTFLRPDYTQHRQMRHRTPWSPGLTTSVPPLCIT